MSQWGPDQINTECERCGEEYHLRDGYDPTPFCDICAHIEVQERTAVIATKDAEIDRLKKEVDTLLKLCSAVATDAKLHGGMISVGHQFQLSEVTEGESNDPTDEHIEKVDLDQAFEEATDNMADEIELELLEKATLEHLAENEARMASQHADQVTIHVPNAIGSKP